MRRVYFGLLTETNIVSLVHAVIDTQTSYLLQLKIKNPNQCFLSLKYILRKKKTKNCCKLSLEPKSPPIKVLLSHGGSGMLTMSQMCTQFQLNSKSDGETTQPIFLSNVLPSSHSLFLPLQDLFQMNKGPGKSKQDHNSVLVMM